MAETNTWQFIFLSAAAVSVALHAFLGWRRGVVRQTIAVVALGAAYLVGWLGWKWTVPIVRPLGIPDTICAILGGAGLGIAAFVSITILGGILFKKTSQQSFFAVRWVYGIGGALIGVAFGLFSVWLALVAIRCTGTIAEAEISEASKNTSLHPGSFVMGLAKLKDSLDHGAAGPFIDRVDPLPGKTYDCLAKITRVASNTEYAQRLLSFPGAKDLAANPRIRALRDDPSIQKAIGDRDLVALLTNEKIVRAANDPEVLRLVRQFEFQKALDQAVRK